MQEPPQPDSLVLTTIQPSRARDALEWQRKLVQVSYKTSKLVSKVGKPPQNLQEMQSLFEWPLYLVHKITEKGKK